MIIEHLDLENFGIYNSKHRFEFFPIPSDRKNITLVRGKNGVGKTTIMEAIELAMMGALSLDSRVAEATYENYLLSRMHQGNSDETELTKTKLASVELGLKYLIAGNPNIFKISRVWRNSGKTLYHQIELKDGEKYVENITEKEKDLFIRQLIPSGIANLIFFDGEYLQSLHVTGKLNEFLKESCKSVFGIHLVEAAQRDIDYYFKKLQNREALSEDLSEGLEKAKSQLKEIQQKEKKLRERILILKEQIDKTEIEVRQQEEKISTEGRLHSELIVKKRERAETLEEKITMQIDSIKSLCSGLIPFVISKNLLEKLKERLRKESEVENHQRVESYVHCRLENLSERFKNESLWQKLSISLSEEERIDLLKFLRSEMLPEQSEKNEVIIHNLTDPDRRKLINWIDRSLNEDSKYLIEETDKLEVFQEELTTVKKELSNLPEDDLVTPMLKKLERLNQKLGKQKLELEQCEEELEKVERKVIFSEQALTAAQKKIKENEDFDKRFALASQAQIVFKEYQEKLLERKLQKLGEYLVEKFNLLCRKKDYFDHAHIDSISYNVSLFQKGKLIDQAFLSAGERQLLTLSALWALRSMTRIKLPLIIDTPLGRLDNNHREIMIDIFLPSISHQVIVLGTEAELDNHFLRKLSDNIARIYELDYHPEKSCTIVSMNNLENILEPNPIA